MTVSNDNCTEVQVHSMICELAKHTDVRSALVVGGLSLSQQATDLRQAPEIVVATPGRIIDHVMNTMAFELDTLSALVLDEADRLLEMGFQDEVLSPTAVIPYCTGCLHDNPQQMGTVNQNTVRPDA